MSRTLKNCSDCSFVLLFTDLLIRYPLVTGIFLTLIPVSLFLSHKWLVGGVKITSTLKPAANITTLNMTRK